MRNIHAKSGLQDERNERNNVDAWVMFGNIHNDLKEQRGEGNARTVSPVCEHRDESNYCEDDSSS